MKPKKKNPSDATFRNINSLKKRVGALEWRTKVIVGALGKHERIISDIILDLEAKRRK